MNCEIWTNCKVCGLVITRRKGSCNCDVEYITSDYISLMEAVTKLLPVVEKVAEMSTKISSQYGKTLDHNMLLRRLRDVKDCLGGIDNVG